MEINRGAGGGFNAIRTQLSHGGRDNQINGVRGRRLCYEHGRLRRIDDDGAYVGVNFI